MSDYAKLSWSKPKCIPTSQEVLFNPLDPCYLTASYKP